MKGFALDNAGDVIIQNNRVQMIDGNELLRQTIQSVLGTNKGEWFLNKDEGITFSNITGKGITEDIIRHEIQQGLLQIDSSFVLTAFELSNTEDRKYKVYFSATNENEEEVSGINYYS